jgi:hypothetical protein
MTAVSPDGQTTGFPPPWTVVEHAESWEKTPARPASGACARSVSKCWGRPGVIRCLRYAERAFRDSRAAFYALADWRPPHPGRLGLPSRVEIVRRVAAIGLHFNPDRTSVSYATVRVLEAPSAIGITGKHIQEVER